MSHLEELTRRAPNARTKEESSWDRHKVAWIARRVGKYGQSLPPIRTKTDLDVLVEHHRFIREEGSGDHVSWEEKVALRWYDKLFREFCLIDLKHYKTGDIALRWRTSDEVVSRLGELTCGSLRCKHHQPEFSPPPSPDPATDRRGIRRSEQQEQEAPLVEAKLMTWQLPFAYVEAGVEKEALVKVVLCDRCGKKLSYKKETQSRDTLKHGRRSASPVRQARRDEGGDRTRT